MNEIFTSFEGTVPKREPHLLGPTQAQVANNVTVDTGAIVPLKTGLSVSTLTRPSQIRTIWRYGQNVDSDTQHWFTSTDDVDFTYGAVKSDTQERVFFTGHGTDGPKWTDATMALSTNAALPFAWRKLGIPAPVGYPGVAIGGAATDTSATGMYLLAAYAYVNDVGEVGPISPASLTALKWRAGQTVNVQGTQGPPAGAYNITTKRIFLSVVDSEDKAAFRFWKDIPVAQADTGASVLDLGSLAEGVDSPSLIPPPNDLFGLMSHPGGFMVGFTKRKFCRSAAWLPYGWPDEYRDPIAEDIVGGAIYGQTVVICTKGKTYVATGQDPENQSIIDLVGTHPCVAKRSIRAHSTGVIYASPDGLVLVNDANPLQLITADLFTRDQWQAFKPESMHAAVFHDRYQVWYDNGKAKGSIILQYAQGEGVRVTTTTQWADATFADKRRDELFCLRGTMLYKHNQGDLYDTGTWRSRKYRFIRPQSVGAFRVWADGYPVQFRMWADDEIVANYFVDDDSPQWLPGATRYREIWFEVLTMHVVRQIEIGSTIGELRGG